VHGGARGGGQLGGDARILQRRAVVAGRRALIAQLPERAGNRSAYDVFSATDGALAGEFLQYLGEEIGTPEAALLQGFSPLGRFYIDDTWYIILINSQQELCYALVLDAAYSYGGTGVLVELDCPGLLSIIGTMDNLRGVNAESESL
jgi:hypothetical protein